MHELRRVAVVLILVFAGCGGGGGGDDDMPVPTPSESATVVPTVSPTPSTAATPDLSFEEIVLGVATRYSGPAYRQFVLRYEDGRWESVPLGLPSDAQVFGVTFASATVAYAFGGRGEATDGVLLRSDDAGRTWHDVGNQLPSDYPQIFDAAFADDRNGYVVGRSFFTPPAVLRTTDGGATWRPVELPPSPGVAIFGNYALGFRADAADLVRYDGGGLVVVALEPPSTAPAVVELSGTASFAGANGFSTAGSAGWIVESFPASILRNDAPGASWTRQFSDGGFRVLNAIDVRGDSRGVAGGAEEFGAGPLLLVTDDGISWQPAIIADGPPGRVIDVLRLRGEDALAVVDIAERDGGGVLRSTDGGHTWNRESTPVGDGWQIHDLARNTERE